MGYYVHPAGIAAAPSGCFLQVLAGGSQGFAVHAETRRGDWVAVTPWYEHQDDAVAALRTLIGEKVSAPVSEFE